MENQEPPYREPKHSDVIVYKGGELTPHELVGFGKFWAEYGAIAGVIVLLAFAALAFFIHYFHTTLTRFNSATKLIEKIAKAHLNSEGEPIRHHEYHATIRDLAIEIKTLVESHDSQALRHYDDVQRLSSEEHWKNCNVDKCPNLQTLLFNFANMVQRFEVFEVAATADRKRTYESLDVLAAELQALGREIIATLRAVRTNGDSKGESNG